MVNRQDVVMKLWLANCGTLRIQESESSQGQKEGRMLGPLNQPDFAVTGWCQRDIRYGRLQFNASGLRVIWSWFCRGVPPNLSRKLPFEALFRNFQIIEKGVLGSGELGFAQLKRKGLLTVLSCTPAEIFWNRRAKKRSPESPPELHICTTFVTRTSQSKRYTDVSLSTNLSSKAWETRKRDRKVCLLLGCRGYLLKEAG